MNNNGIESNVLASIDTEINGKPFVYKIEHERFNFLDGKSTDTLMLTKTSKLSGKDYSHEIINMDNFYNMKDEDKHLFEDKAKAYMTEAYDLFDKDTSLALVESKNKLNTLKW